MKRIIDFIGDAIVKLFQWTSFILLPFVALAGIVTGLYYKVRGVKYQTFRKTFEGLGEMSSRSTSEKGCRYWHKDTELGPWKDVNLIVGRNLLFAPHLREVILKELRLAQQNMGDVLDSIRKDPVYLNAVSEGIDTLVPDDQVNAELCIGEPGYLDPYVSVFYNTDHYYVWFSIQDGEMTSFDLYDTKDE